MGTCCMYRLCGGNGCHYIGSTFGRYDSVVLFEYSYCVK